MVLQNRKVGATRRSIYITRLERERLSLFLAYAVTSDVFFTRSNQENLPQARLRWLVYLSNLIYLF
jgi:hypothetical protein